MTFFIFLIELSLFFSSSSSCTSYSYSPQDEVHCSQWRCHFWNRKRSHRSVRDRETRECSRQQHTSSSSFLFSSLYSASSTGLLLKTLGLKVTAIKIDPYMNIDAGTMAPTEHGEVFVLNDGGEADLDLGNYERYLDVTLRRDNNITTGKIYSQVIDKEVSQHSPTTMKERERERVVQEEEDEKDSWTFYSIISHPLPFSHILLSFLYKSSILYSESRITTSAVETI